MTNSFSKRCSQSKNRRKSTSKVVSNVLENLAISPLNGKTLIGDDNSRLDIDINSLDRYGYTALHRACSTGNQPLTEYLIDSGVEVNIINKFGESAIHSACFDGHVAIVMLLIDAGADVNIHDSNGFTPINWAARNNRYEIVVKLIESRADINITDYCGVSPLQGATLKGNLKIMKALILAGASMNIGDLDGNTPISTAVAISDESIARHASKLLLRNGANPNIKNNVNDAPIHRAITKRNYAVVKYLAEAAGVDIDVQNRHGETPISLACSKGSLSIVKFLADKGADIELENNRNLSPHMNADLYHHNSIAEYLLTILNSGQHRRNMKWRRRKNFAVLINNLQNNSEVVPSSVSRGLLCYDMHRYIASFL